MLDITGLPDGALDAAGAFHRDWLPRAREALAAGIDALVLLLPEAPYDHEGWRRAVVQDLARTHAPQRVNLLAGGDAAARAAMIEWLAGAPGITGQMLALDGQGAGNPAG
ncbi:MAG: hypothetical protein IE933_01930 [Sphingomonadales bacterium]|nr:hypothetical protein [Sphingomonadales bacterium]MBD3773387.1 hypothetical protein [Paracoccaceae bacterium]